MEDETYGTRRGEREALLTFDDGPHHEFTPRLLDVLAREGVKAMFFVLGNRISTPKGREIMERAHREGHQIGNHSFSHPNLRQLSAAQVRDELKRTQDLIGDCAAPERFFRPPYGATNSTVAGIVREMEMEQIMWTVDPEDWKAPRDGSWVTRAVEAVRRREDALLVLHDIHKSTVDGVDDLIAGIRGLPNTRFYGY